MSLSFPTSPSVGQVYQNWIWNGSAWTTISGSGAPALLGVQVFTSSGTYVPKAGMAACLIECVGGGAGGNGSTVAPTSVYATGAGGGSGGYSRKYATAAMIGASQPVTVGSGGVAGLATGLGGAGGDSSVAALCVAHGAPAPAGPATVAGQVAGLGAAPGVGDFAVGGNPGGPGVTVAAGGSTAGGGAGGVSVFGGGAAGLWYTQSAPGNSAGPYGSGGSGGMAYNGASNPGGAASAGVVIITEYGSGQGPQGPAGNPGVMRSYLAGLTLSTAGGSANFSVAPGVAADSTNVFGINIASALSKSTAAFSPGGGGGALDAAAIAASTWYHAYVIYNPTTQASDVLVSLSATAPAMPSGFTLFRRIGAMKTDASSHWIAFTQNGDEFLWMVPVQDMNAGTINATATLIPFSVPSGVQVWPIGSYLGAAGATTYILVTSPDQADTTPSGTALDFSITTGQTATSPLPRRRTNTSSQLRFRGSAASTANYIETHGWIDRRGRDL
jgi:hypothetical protein